jgi:hypothetical protein
MWGEVSAFTFLNLNNLSCLWIYFHILEEKYKFFFAINLGIFLPHIFCIPLGIEWYLLLLFFNHCLPRLI